MRKDYYLILGVPHEESLRGIQAAFRDLAKRYHPDWAGPQGTGKFQDIQEAYGVLSDPEKRKLYNEEEIGKRGRAEPMFSQAHTNVELLIPERRSVLRDFATIRPSFESLFDRLARNFTEERIPKGERLESLNVEVILSPDEAAWGVIVPMGVPVFYTCPECRGSGHISLFPCMDCNAQGTIEGERTVLVRIPPLAANGSVVEVPIRGLGIHNFYLCLHVRILG